MEIRKFSPKILREFVETCILLKRYTVVILVRDGEDILDMVSWFRDKQVYDTGGILKSSVGNKLSASINFSNGSRIVVINTETCEKLRECSVACNAVIAYEASASDVEKAKRIIKCVGYQVTCGVSPRNQEDVADFLKRMEPMFSFELERSRPLLDFLNSLKSVR